MYNRLKMYKYPLFMYKVCMVCMIIMMIHSNHTHKNKPYNTIQGRKILGVYDCTFISYPKSPTHICVPLYIYTRSLYIYIRTTIL